MPKNFLIYGSYGYTGNLIARLAVQRGLRPILAGRDPQRLAQQAVELGLEHFAFSLDDQKALHRVLPNVDVVLHCAGPFIHTVRPMASACLGAGVHYLDITGEIGVFELLASLHDQAKEVGVMLLPGVGFDVVPSDCLAAHLKRRLPTATHLALAIRFSGGGTSPGTASTALENIGSAGAVRRNGEIVSIAPGSLTRKVNFGRGLEFVAAVPWGDVSTAYYSTGIPNVETYFAMPSSMRWGLSSTRYFGGILSSRPAKGAIKKGAQKQFTGPTEEQRAKGKVFLWGEVTDDAGQRRVTRMRTPESYTLTAQTALAVVEMVLAGQVRPGFQTPSLAYGPDFIMQFDGVQREDVGDDAG